MAASGAEWPRHQLVLSVKDNNHAVPVPGVGPWDLRATQMTNVPRGVGQGWGRGGREGPAPFCRLYSSIRAAVDRSCFPVSAIFSPLHGEETRNTHVGLRLTPILSEKVEL